MSESFLAFAPTWPMYNEMQSVVLVPITADMTLVVLINIAYLESDPEVAAPSWRFYYSLQSSWD